MKEEFLQYIWKQKLFDHGKLYLSTGEIIEVLDVGERNTDAGPDFFNARIKIGETTWAGNVEVHINASDWERHQHNRNKAYDNVILHVVLNDDKIITNTNGAIIPALEIIFNNRLYDNYRNLLSNKLWIACRNYIRKTDTFLLEEWLNSLLVERLENKTNYILKNLSVNGNDWEETFYQQLARNFGFKLNADPFELLAKSLPEKYLKKHKDNLFQLEAMLFGQAGMLEENIDNEYFTDLKKEYAFLRHKFNLIPLEKHLWKFSRSRPSNFPTVRIAQFAALLYRSDGLFSQVLEIDSITDPGNLFSITASEFWDTHYLFNKSSEKKKKTFGDFAFQIIVINTVVPFIFTYGKVKDNKALKDRAISFLEELGSENNSIIKKWETSGIRSSNAFYSQSLIQLKNNYCNQKKCLNCRIGNKIITAF